MAHRWADPAQLKEKRHWWENEWNCTFSSRMLYINIVHVSCLRIVYAIFLYAARQWYCVDAFIYIHECESFFMSESHSFILSGNCFLLPTGTETKTVFPLRFSLNQLAQRLFVVVVCMDIYRSWGNIWALNIKLCSRFNDTLLCTVHWYSIALNSFACCVRDANWNSFDHFEYNCAVYIVFLFK